MSRHYVVHVAAGMWACTDDTLAGTTPHDTRECAEGRLRAIREAEAFRADVLNANARMIRAEVNRVALRGAL